MSIYDVRKSVQCISVFFKAVTAHML